MPATTPSPFLLPYLVDSDPVSLVSSNTQALAERLTELFPDGELPDPPVDVPTTTKYALFRASAAQSIGHDSPAVIKLPSTTGDTIGFTRQGDAFKFPGTGIFEATAQIPYAWKNSTAEKRATITVRRAAGDDEIAVQTNTSTNGLINLTAVFQASASDLLLLTGFQFTGGALLTITTPTTSWLAVRQIA